MQPPTPTTPPPGEPKFSHGAETQNLASLHQSFINQNPLITRRRKILRLYIFYIFIDQCYAVTLFKNKYRIESSRLSSWDYGENAPYFITICTHQRVSYFGEITDGNRHLSQIGVVADECWRKIPEHFPFVELDEHVVMPNHVHGIIVINKEEAVRAIKGNMHEGKFGPQSRNIGSIIRGFKVGVSKHARLNDVEFKWQPRFHDHIIRNEESFMKIRNYITSNIGNWHNDTFYSALVQPIPHAKN